MNERTFHTQSPPLGAKLYLAGPMRGLPDGGREAFATAKRALCNQGYQVISPAEHDAALGIDVMAVEPRQLREVMLWDLEQVAAADALVLLPGWQRSEGANLELRFARFSSVPVWEWDGVELAWLPARPTLVGLSGFAGVGKDTLAQALEPYGFERVAFADKVKQMALRLDPELAGRVAAGADLETLKRSSLGVRAWLQAIGMVVREVLHEDAWVDAVLGSLDPRGRYVISDVRFRNEAARIRSSGGLLVRVERPGFGPANDHVSERDLANRDDWDLVVQNTGSLEEVGFWARRIVDLVEGVAGTSG